jgi:hypothetical protein
MKIVWQDEDIVSGVVATNGTTTVHIIADKERANFCLADLCKWEIVAVNSPDGLATFLTAKNYLIVKTN